MERIMRHTNMENFEMAKINISMPSSILEKIDHARLDLQMGRSEFLRRASQAYLDALAVERRLREKLDAIGKAIRVQDRIAEDFGDWNAEGLLRKNRDLRK